MANTNELSALSYINKDFNTLYPEVLDLAKKLSYKWDPSISNESDPGVVLIKLLCLMADKLNFNIDTNILELFPGSVSQIQNARQLYDQLGCPMRYYRAAQTNITFAIDTSKEQSALTDTDAKELGFESAEDLTRENPRTYIIPKFTMVSDQENHYVFSTIRDCSISSDGRSAEVPAIQGVSNTFTINGNSLITDRNINYENRLYFTELDIAENGIFIESKSDPNNYWTRVDNLELQPLGSRCFRFGINDLGTQCFIEFPSDIDTIIGEGIYITYIRTLGFEGNISLRVLSQLYSETKMQRYVVPSQVQTITSSKDILYINNYLPATEGLNPETIEEVQKRYQRLKNTFETLVSLDDYTNFMISNKNVSNGFVCDRTNDIQSSYKILEYNDETERATEHVTFQTKEAPPHECEMNAFNLRVYATKYVSNILSAEQFTATFEPLNDSTSIGDMYNLLNNSSSGWSSLKSIQHDFLQYESNRPIMFKNKYLIEARIIPQFKITSLQENEIKNVVKKALRQVLNAKEINFGDPIDYNLIFDTIINSDPRIKALILNDITYETYAIYKNSDGAMCELRIDKNAPSPADASLETLFNTFRLDIQAKSILAGKTQFLISDYPVKMSLAQTNSEINHEVSFIGTDSCITAAASSEEVTDSIYDGTIKCVTGLREYAEAEKQGFGYINIDSKSNDDILGASINSCNVKIHGENISVTSSDNFIANLTFTFNVYATGSDEDVAYRAAINDGHITNNGCFTVPISTQLYSRTPILHIEFGSVTTKVTKIKCGETLAKLTTRIELPGAYVTQDSQGNVLSYEGPNDFIINILQELYENSSAFTCVEFGIKRNATAATDIDILRRRAPSGIIEETCIYTPKLRENENIILTAPNLIEGAPYSGYTKFIYRFNSQNRDEVIYSNTDYTLLGANEYIAFFWKTEEEGNYHYKIYRGFQSPSPTENPPTISPSFSLKKIQPNIEIKTAEGSSATWRSIEIPHDSILSNLIPANDSRLIIEGVIVGDPYITLYNSGTPVNKSLNAFISEDLIGSDYCLTGTNKITPKTCNKIEITPHFNTQTKEYEGTSLGFWILNNHSNNKCTLFGSGEDEYTLSANEYFLYTNTARTEIHMLGSGTLLTRTSSDETIGEFPEWSCDIITYDELIEDPQRILNNAWSNMKGAKLYATEYQFYQLGPEYQLKLTPKDEDIFTQIEINSTQLTILDGNQGTGSAIHDLRNYEVSFIDSQDVETKLPSRNYYEYAWKANTLLNINMSPQKPQTLVAGQTIYLYDENSTTIGTYGVLPSDSHSKIFLLSNVILDTVGGSKIDVRSADSESDILKPIGIYKHELPAVDPENTIWDIKSDSGKVECIIDSGTDTSDPEFDAAGEYTLSFNLPEGKYILPLTVQRQGVLPDGDSSSIKIKYGSNYLDILQSLDASNTGGHNCKDTGKYLLKLDLLTGVVNGMCTGSIFIEVDLSTSSEASLIFDSPYKYVYKNPISESDTSLSFDQVLEKTVNLDKENKFNYLYQVPEEDKIDNPLDPISFTRENHIFNKFTICEWNQSNSHLVIESRLK